ncbi:MAG TPA: hypothetical protein QF624_07795 [Dehalococcoidia bacterium]|nr:hypothetical protein [Dehalococcoidia bacterium]
MRRIPAAAMLLAVLVATPLAMLGAGILIAGTAAAQEAAEPRIDVQIRFEPPTAGLGEHVELVLAIQHPTTLLLTATAPAPSAGLDVLSSDQPTIEQAGESAVTFFRYQMVGFDLGNLAPGEIRISWLAADGRGDTLTIAPPPLLIATTLTDDAELRPLKAQVSIDGGPPAWQRPAAGGVLAFALLGIVAWVVVHQRERESVDVPAERQEGPESRARDQLNRLSAARLIEIGDLEGYYGAISFVVRGYVEDRFAFRAMAMTTSELQQQMEDRGVERWQARLVAELLDRCDAAVYAGRHPDPTSADHDLTVAFEIVELTRPASLVAPA